MVVHIDAVCDGVESAFITKAFEDGEQFVLAVETAHGIVSKVGGIFEFVGFDNGDGNLVVARKGERLLEMSSGQARRVGNHGEHLAAENLMRRPGKERGIHAARISDDQTRMGCEELTQALSFPGE